MSDQRKEINTQLSDTLFGIDGQMRELDTYKAKYESMGQGIQEMSD